MNGFSVARYAAVKIAAFAAIAISLSSCGGGGGIGATAPPKAQSDRSEKGPHAEGQVPGIGVRASLVHGWANTQIVADRSRRTGRAIEGAPAPVRGGAMKRITSVGRRTTLSTGGASALVLYDNTGQWGYLGELYAMAIANLAGHFGSVASEPISAYTAGQVNQFTSTIYVGSTYYGSLDSIPTAFYTDVASSTHPVIWMGDNIWYFADAIGPAAFEGEYGWDPTNSYFSPNGSVGDVTQVTYKNEALTRSIPSGDDGGILHPYILGGSYPAVTTLATAVDTSTSPSTTFPWAIRSGNLTYIGEIPFAFVNETDRVIAFEDLLFDALAPNTATQHRAMMRLEDLNANMSATNLQKVATYLNDQHISYGFNVIPVYTDPLGYYNNGVPQTVALSQAPSFVKVIKYMIAHGGTMIDEGYTHQYGSVDNPYSGVSGDDAEFFMAHVDANNNVIWDGPTQQDSSSWAAGRVSSAVSAFTAAGLTAPSIWVTPHYFATDVDYEAIAQAFPERYERSLYFAGLLSGGTVNHSEYIGEFFPYVVQDVYGTKVLPENLGDYEPTSLNNNPVRLPADLTNEAQLNTAVRDGFASFFYDPSYGTTPLGQIITGIKKAGYTFVSPASL
jgi:uncharacterized protein YdaL